MPQAMPHQIAGAAFLADRGFAMLLDPPGLGKTLTTILAADRVGADRILVACPSVIRAHWAREFCNWQSVSRSITVCDGLMKTNPQTGVNVFSHAACADHQSISHLCAGAPYDLIILDESHFFRNANASRSRRFWLGESGHAPVWRMAKHVWVLTGTPVVNSAADLWLMAQGPMGHRVDWYDWCQRFCEWKPSSYGEPTPFGVKNHQELAGVMQPHALRRSFESVGVELPPLTVNYVTKPLESDALQQAMAKLEHWTPDRLAQALAEKDELRDAAMSRVRRVLGLVKTDIIADHIHELLSVENSPIVVFFQHTEVRSLLHKNLTARGHVVSWIDGTINRRQLDAAEKWFNAGNLSVLLVQTDAGGTGLTLVRGHRVVIAELPWTAVSLHQAIKRVHRIGQCNPVSADIIQVKDNWLESALASVVNKKQQAADRLLSLLET